MTRSRKTQCLGMTSTELDKKYPFWRNQATSKGGHNTVSANSTIKTYAKIADFIVKKMPKASVLDASSGAGAGTELLRKMKINCEDVEPFVSSERKKPTYTDYNKIRKKYDVVISNAVINVIPDDWRETLIKQMASLVAKGGMLIINTRSAKEIQDITKNVIVLDDSAEKIVQKGKNSYAYQRGFDIKKLKTYVQKLVGKTFEVVEAKASNCGVTTGKAVVCFKL